LTLNSNEITRHHYQYQLTEYNMVNIENETLESSSKRPFHRFVENIIRFDDWARNNKIKFLEKNNPELLAQLIKDKKI